VFLFVFLCTTIQYSKFPGTIDCKSSSGQDPDPHLEVLEVLASLLVRQAPFWKLSAGMKKVDTVSEENKNGETKIRV
jgi:hypothetical protein